MAYRDLSEQADETDPEAAVIALLRTRAGRVRTAIHVPLLLGGIFGGAVLYVALRELQFATNGALMPTLAEQHGLDLAELEESTRLLE